MNKKQFFMHVVTMRHNQTQWFATHDKNALECSKRLEQECDDEIVRACILDPDMEQFVRTEFPELVSRINKAKNPSFDLFGNPV